MNRPECQRKRRRPNMANVIPDVKKDGGYAGILPAESSSHLFQASPDELSLPAERTSFQATHRKQASGRRDARIRPGRGHWHEAPEQKENQPAAAMRPPRVQPCYKISVSQLPP